MHRKIIVEVSAGEGRYVKRAEIPYSIVCLSTPEEAQSLIIQSVCNLELAHTRELPAITSIQNKLIDGILPTKPTEKPAEEEPKAQEPHPGTSTEAIMAVQSYVFPPELADEINRCCTILSECRHMPFQELFRVSSSKKAAFFIDRFASFKDIQMYIYIAWSKNEHYKDLSKPTTRLFDMLEQCDPHMEYEAYKLVFP